MKTTSDKTNIRKSLKYGVWFFIGATFLLDFVMPDHSFLQYHTIDPNSIERLYIWTTHDVVYTKDGAAIPAGTTLTAEEVSQFFDLLKYAKQKRQSIILGLLQMSVERIYRPIHAEWSGFVVGGSMNNEFNFSLFSLNKTGRLYGNAYFKDKNAETAFIKLIERLKSRFQNPDDRYIRFLNELNNGG